MSIGEDLAQARCRAGLSVTEVSQRTRIRQTIICGIEHDDYSACGGDFYARGHIRAIARAVGADPGPLIGEYDAAHPTPQAVMAADLFRPPAGPASHWRRHRRAWAVVLGLALAAPLVFAAYHAVMGAHRAPGAPAGVAAGLHDRADHAAPPAARQGRQLTASPALAASKTRAPSCRLEPSSPGCLRPPAGGLPPGTAPGGPVAASQVGSKSMVVLGLVPERGPR